MSPSLSRRAALGIGRRLPSAFPARLSSWARAMEAEIEQIDGDGQALVFALGCLWAGWRSAALERFSLLTGDDDMTNGLKEKLRQPRTIGIASAIAATLLGLSYLAAAGAPARYVGVNLAALALGLVALGGLDKAGLNGPRSSGIAVALSGAALIATALFGASADGASRWIWIGPLAVQVSLVLVPFMLVSFARHPDRLGIAGIALAAIALALQPDRAVAGMLALGLAALATARRDVHSLTALLVALAAFAATLARPDRLPASPFVDGIVYSAFSVHPLAGVAIVLGLSLLVLPAFAARPGDADDEGARRAFGALWIAGIAAAALGNYPTPVVGYGGSAILGYVLSLSAFPARLGAERRLANRRREVAKARSDRPQRRSGPVLSRS